MMYKPYPKYKDSGIEWLGEIPEGWEENRLRFRTLLNPYKSEVRNLPLSTIASFTPMEAIGEYGGMNIEQTKLLDEVLSGYTYFRDGDVIIAKITPCFENGKGSIASGLENGIGFGTTELHVLRPKPELNRRYLFYLTISHAFRNIGASFMYGAGGQKRVPDEFIRNFLHPIPSYEEQHAIAYFLDRETSRIDSLIAKKQRQIELLQEKRSALISHSVTRGINPNVKMKDSGIEWMGEIPEHWDIYRAKVLFKEINDRSTTGEEELLSVSHITGVTRRSEKNVNMFMAESMEGYKKCKSGDLVINTMWAWMGAMGIAFEPGIVSPSYNVYRPRTSDIDPGFYDFMFRTGRFISEVICQSKGVWSSRLRLYPEAFFEIRLPYPPIQEQREIVKSIIKGTGEYSLLQQKIEHSIEKLREYRSALISTSVTGKIDVRGEVD